MKESIYRNMKFNKEVFRRFIKKVEIKSDGCWLWTGATHEWGYGHLKIPGQKRNIKAHRLSWIFYRGKIPVGKYVLHKCDRPSCVSPNHLFLGTLKDNSKDMIKKGRGKNQFKKGHRESVEVKMKRSRALLGNKNAIGGNKLVKGLIST